MVQTCNTPRCAAVCDVACRFSQASDERSSCCLSLVSAYIHVHWLCHYYWPSKVLCYYILLDHIVILVHIISVVCRAEVLS